MPYMGGLAPGQGGAGRPGGLIYFYFSRNQGQEASFYFYFSRFLGQEASFPFYSSLFLEVSGLEASFLSLFLEVSGLEASSCYGQTPSVWRVWRAWPPRYMPWYHPSWYTPPSRIPGTPTSDTRLPYPVLRSTLPGGLHHANRRGYRMTH